MIKVYIFILLNCSEW